MFIMSTIHFTNDESHVITPHLYTQSLNSIQTLIFTCKTICRCNVVTLLPSAKRYTSICCHATRLWSSFFPQAETPQVILSTTIKGSLYCVA